MIDGLEYILEQIKSLPLDEKINALNEVRTALHDVSPFVNEPVDLVLWVGNENVVGNSYNPNHVAKKEMELLVDSIDADGFTQPIVTNPETNFFSVVDGFHRKLVGSDDGKIKTRLHGYLPITLIDKSQEERRFSTIRHNRARGRHSCDLMGDLMKDLVQRGCSDGEISAHMGMSIDEIVRLKQVVGIAKLFAGPEYTRAWGESDEI